MSLLQFNKSTPRHTPTVMELSEIEKSEYVTRWAQPAPIDKKTAKRGFLLCGFASVLLAGLAFLFSNYSAHAPLSTIPSTNLSEKPIATVHTTLAKVLSLNENHFYVIKRVITDDDSAQIDVARARGATVYVAAETAPAGVKFFDCKNKISHEGIVVNGGTWISLN